MARPSTPLIDRDATIATALRIIDEEGLEALSLPRLARELDVKAPSLYHHFRDKDEILAAVAQRVVGATVAPRKPADGDWPAWFTQLVLNFRTAVLRHRNAAPLLLQFLPREWLTDVYEDAAAYLAACGVPAELHLQVLDSLERFAFGATILEAMRTGSSRRLGYEHADPEGHPALTAALAANSLTQRQLFAEAVRCYLVGVEQAGASAA